MNLWSRFTILVVVVGAAVGVLISSKGFAAESVGQRSGMGFVWSEPVGELAAVSGPSAGVSRSTQVGEPGEKAIVVETTAGLMVMLPDSGTIALVDRSTLTERVRKSIETEGSVSMVVTKQGVFLQDEKGIRILALDDLSERLLIRAPSASPSMVARDDGSVVVALDAGEVALIDDRGEQARTTIGAGDVPLALGATATGRIVVADSGSGNVVVLGEDLGADRLVGGINVGEGAVVSTAYGESSLGDVAWLSGDEGTVALRTDSGLVYQVDDVQAITQIVGFDGAWFAADTESGDLVRLDVESGVRSRDSVFAPGTDFEVVAGAGGLFLNDPKSNQVRWVDDRLVGAVFTKYELGGGSVPGRGDPSEDNAAGPPQSEPQKNDSSEPSALPRSASSTTSTSRPLPPLGGSALASPPISALPAPPPATTPTTRVGGSQAVPQTQAHPSPTPVQTGGTGSQFEGSPGSASPQASAPGVSLEGVGVASDAGGGSPSGSSGAAGETAGTSSPAVGSVPGAASGTSSGVSSSPGVLAAGAQPPGTSGGGPLTTDSSIGSKNSPMGSAIANPVPNTPIATSMPFPTMQPGGSSVGTTDVPVPSTPAASTTTSALDTSFQLVTSSTTTTSGSPATTSTTEVTVAPTTSTTLPAPPIELDWQQIGTTTQIRVWPLDVPVSASQFEWFVDGQTVSSSPELTYDLGDEENHQVQLVLNSGDLVSEALPLAIPPLAAPIWLSFSDRDVNEPNTPTDSYELNLRSSGGPDATFEVRLKGDSYQSSSSASLTDPKFPETGWRAVTFAVPFERWRDLTGQCLAVRETRIGGTPSPWSTELCYPLVLTKIPDTDLFWLSQPFCWTDETRVAFIFRPDLAGRSPRVTGWYMTHGGLSGFLDEDHPGPVLLSPADQSRVDLSFQLGELPWWHRHPSYEGLSPDQFAYWSSLSYPVAWGVSNTAGSGITDLPICP